jgi:hypothetical protein
VLSTAQEYERNVSERQLPGLGDDRWGALDRVLLRFSEGGSQVLRVQTREDGVSFDQVVLSAEKYLTTRPGAPKEDTTILPATQR